MEAESAPAVRRVPVRRVVGAVLPFMLTAALTGAVKGIALLYEHSAVGLAHVAALAAGVLLLIVLLILSAACGAGRVGEAVLVVATLLVLGGAATGLIAAVNEVDRRVLHERGVVATGVVYAHRQFGGGGGTVDVPPARLSDVRLADGSTLSVDDTDSGSDRPAVNSEVTVTYDPKGQVPARFGPRPDLPGTGPAAVGQAMVVAGSLCLSAVVLSRRSFDL
nr:hypothetical protein KPHV_00250 [Kitasatospora purpeofusca]